MFHSATGIFYRQVLVHIPQILSGIFIFAIFWILSLVVKGLIVKAGRRTRRIDLGLVVLFGRISRIGIVLFGAVTALGTMGVNVSALIAGLGLSSFALGFAFKDALSNLLAGISILLYRPFRPGDRINVTGFEGTVVEIDLRYTNLDAGDKTILVPNSNLFTNAVTVYHRETATYANTRR